MGCSSSMPVDNNAHHNQHQANGNVPNGSYPEPPRPVGPSHSPSPPPKPAKDPPPAPPKTPTPPPTSPTPPPPKTPTPPPPKTPTPPPKTPNPPPKTPTPPPPKTPTPPPKTPTPPPPPPKSPTQEEEQQQQQEEKEKKEDEQQAVDKKKEEEETNEPIPEENQPEEKEEKERKLPEKPEEADEDEERDQDADADVTERDGVKFVAMGRETTVLDARTDKSSLDSMAKPSVDQGSLWTDPDFPFDVAMEGSMEPGIEWKRPGDIVENPLLFSSGSTRFDVGQGRAGTCYFLSILASLADKKDVMHEVVPDDAYPIGTDSYNGVFHCRFWRFGEWMDVYIDDYLPVHDGRIWGAHSSTDPNEMWISLVEKAFAKLLGNYQDASGGWAGDAFIALTGGTAEIIKVKDTTKKQLFDRVTNALSAGSVIACSVPQALDGRNGLVGGHAYTLTGTAKVSYEGKNVCLMRVRNPWGTDKGEWNGPWADKSSEWDQVNSGAKERKNCSPSNNVPTDISSPRFFKKFNLVLNVQCKGDGEFWMSLKDYVDYFPDTHVCNLSPDFDKDGTPDGLDKVSLMYGEWKGDTAAGADIDKKFNNQKFTITVPDTGSSVPIVLQLLRKKDTRHDRNDCYMRLDCYKIEAEREDDKTYLVLDEITNFLTFWGGTEYSYRYLMDPGKYVLVPLTMNPGIEKQFCIRAFSSVQLPCSHLESLPGLFVRKEDTSFEYNGTKQECSTMQHIFGEWKSGINAGGQVANRSFDKNPQYVINIDGEASEAPLHISLKQLNEEPKLAVGFKIYPAPEGIPIPMDLNTLYRNFGTCLKDINNRNVFVISYEGASNYVIPKGRYVVVVFTDQPDKEKKYVMSFGTPNGCSLSFESYNCI